MVDPISSAERSSFARRVKVAFVLVVGVSAGMIALRGDASPVVLGGAVVVGLLVGAVLVRFVFPGTGEVTSTRSEAEPSGDGPDWDRARRQARNRSDGGTPRDREADRRGGE